MRSRKLRDSIKYNRYSISYFQSKNTKKRSKSINFKFNDQKKPNEIKFKDYKERNKNRTINKKVQRKHLKNN